MTFDEVMEKVQEEGNENQELLKNGYISPW